MTRTAPPTGARGVREGPPHGSPKDWPRELGTVAWGRPSFPVTAGPTPGLSGAATEARDRLVDASLHTYIHMAHLAYLDQIGCADWLVAQKDIMESEIFC